MKRIVFALIALLIFQLGQAQIGIPTWLHDKLSSGSYKDMVRDFGKIAAVDAASAVTINYMKNVINDRAKSMLIVGSPLANRRLNRTIEAFITNGASRYLGIKYPIQSPSNVYNHQSMFKNIAIHTRFRKKFADERRNVRNYLAIRSVRTRGYLYITEGERILLTLDALQNTTNTVLENEEY